MGMTFESYWICRNRFNAYTIAVVPVNVLKEFTEFYLYSFPNNLTSFVTFNADFWRIALEYLSQIHREVRTYIISARHSTGKYKVFGVIDHNNFFYKFGTFGNLVTVAASHTRVPLSLREQTKVIYERLLPLRWPV